MSEHFPEPQSHFAENVKVKLDLSNYATKPDVKKQQVMRHFHFQKYLVRLRIRIREISY